LLRARAPLRGIVGSKGFNAAATKIRRSIGIFFLGGLRGPGSWRHIHVSAAPWPQEAPLTGPFSGHCLCGTPVADSVLDATLRCPPFLPHRPPPRVAG